jgi:PAS domain S-box-containing protein
MNVNMLDFEQARTKHLNFKIQLRSILYGDDIDQTPVLSHHECAVGKWIYGYAMNRYQHIPEMIALEKLHADLHVCARELVDLYKSGKVPEAREGLIVMEEIAEKLVALLTAIESKIVQDGEIASPESMDIHHHELVQLRQAVQQLDERIKIETTVSTTARKEAEVSESKFRESVEQAPVGMIILRGDDVIVEMANKAYLDLVDRKKEDLLGKPFFSAIPEVKETIRPLFDKVLKTGVPHYGNEVEIPINRYGRPEKTFFNFIYQPLRDVDGNTDGIIAVVNEITEQVKAKHALQESEVRFRNLVTQSPIAMTIFKGPEFIIDMANDTMTRIMWRRQPTEVHGRKLLDVFPELASQPFPAILKRVYESGITHRENEALAYINGPDGMKRFYLDYEYAPLLDLDKKVYAIIATVYDVTERKENELALRQSEEKFRILADSMPQFIWTADIEGNLNYFSQSVYAYTGMTAKEINDNSWLEFIHPSERENNMKQWSLSVSSGEPFIFEHRFRKHDGTYRWQLSRGIPQKDAEGNIQMWVGTSTDIHDSKISIDKLETLVQERTQALQRSNDELKKTNSELEQFAYVASHDLQEPLRKIQTFASRLVETEFASLSDKGKDYFGRMQAASKRMQQLIEDLLSFSHTTNGDQLFEQTDLTAILLRVQELLSDQIEAKHAIINCDPLPVLPVIAYQIEQLCTNLINNALKFSRPDIPAVIEIKLDSKPTYVSGIAYYKITVADNGIGFDPQFNERIFQVFQRLHAKNQFEGTGIGLAICKKIMDNHKGFISAMGILNEGATFTLLFPVG